MILLAYWLLHRDPRLWQRPDTFDPLRFVGSEPDRFAYLPFGGGARQCIGERLAWLEGVLVLAAIGQQWRLRPVGTWGAEPSAVASLRPRGGLPMAAERRRADG